VQKALAQSADEIRQLQATAQALRQELDRLKFEKDKTEQAAIASGEDEIRQLKATAQALRQELQLLRFEKDEAEQAAIAGGADEIRQLKDTAAELRERFQRVTIECEDRIQELTRDFRNEKKCLHKKFSVLSDDLEEAPVAGEPVEEQDG